MVGTKNTNFIFMAIMQKLRFQFVQFKNKNRESQLTLLNGLWQDNMVISAFSNVQKQYLVVQRQFMPQMVVHGGTKLERQNH